MKTPPKPAEPLPSGDSRPTRPPVSSKDLLGGATMLEIDHAGQTYFLRVTRENKLILTK